MRKTPPGGNLGDGGMYPISGQQIHMRSAKPHHT
jgi:hypothetical protein